MTDTTRAVTQDEDGIRLDRWLRRHVPGLGQAQVQKWCRTGQVRVDGGRVEASLRLASGQNVRVPPVPVARPQPVATGTTITPNPVTRHELEDLILYRDDALIVFNKPAGLAVQGGPGIHRHLDGMLESLREPGFHEGARPRLVHRLDRDTSGVLVVARTPGVAAKLAAAFRGRDVHKTYWAVVSGRPEPEAGRIDLALVRVGKGAGALSAVAQKGDEDAARALTEYRTLEQAGRKLSWMELRPITGRTHQLRVHCVALGAPILGDLKYHEPDQNGAFNAIVDGLSNRLHLHARTLELPHPEGGLLVVEAPLPPHMQATFKTLGFEARPPMQPKRTRA
jgi:23S rRNA pseudouridine955/2504/2580 synthase